MEIEYTRIPGVVILKPKRFDDNRGWFMETYSKDKYFIDFNGIQDNVSFTKKCGTIRGMHLQIGEHSQGKIVSCLKGKLLDVVYDLRPNSPTYLQKVAVELSSDNNYQLFIPRGLAHGFQTLSDDVIFMYKCDNLYDKKSERCIHYLDKTFNMDWPIKDITISDKDKLGLTTEEYNNSIIKVLVTGASGLLGSSLKKELENQHYQVLAPTHEELDITLNYQVDNYFQENKPDIVIHCAAYTNVNGAENNKAYCNLLNVCGTANITRACQKHNSKLAYISTEYVFDGTKKTPYVPEDKTNPVNYYGYTKMLGEDITKMHNKSFIIRTSWLYDNYGNNFPNKIINLANSQQEITVVDDQIGSPTYVHDLAKGIITIVKSDDYGIYHLTNKDYCSFYELAQKVCEIKGLDVKITSISSEDFRKLYPSSVLRPKNSRMEDNLHNIEMPNYEDALIRCLKKDNH